MNMSMLEMYQRREQRRQELVKAVDKPQPIQQPTQHQPTTPPVPGKPMKCGCCGNTTFWNERVEPKGWRCAWCHPPVHLAGEEIVTHGDKAMHMDKRHRI